MAALRGATSGPRPAIYASFLVRRDRSLGGPARDRKICGDLGVLVGRDPVAVDAAARDLIAEHCGGSLQAWSGFPQGPDALLARAAALGLGDPAYRLERHSG